MATDWTDDGEEPRAAILPAGIVRLTCISGDSAMPLHRWRAFLERERLRLARWERERSGGTH